MDKPRRPANDPHFTWSDGDVTFNIPIVAEKETVVSKDKNAPIPASNATQAERDMYTRYVKYFDSGQSPYSGPAPLPFFMWMKLKPQHRPGGPE